MAKKRSFFQRLTGGINIEDEEEVAVPAERTTGKHWIEEENEEAELTVDV